MAIIYLEHKKVAQSQLEKTEKKVVFLVTENVKMKELFEKDQILDVERNVTSITTENVELKRIYNDTRFQEDGKIMTLTVENFDDTKLCVEYEVNIVVVSTLNFENANVQIQNLNYDVHFEMVGMGVHKNIINCETQ